MGQNFLGQWNCRIFKSTISPEHNDNFFNFDTNLLKLKIA